MDRAKHETVIDGEINSNHFDNRNRYGYWFEANGRLYTGHGDLLGPTLPVGAKITVHYDARDPTENVLGVGFVEMAAAARGDAIGVWFLSAIVATGMALLVKYNRRVTYGRPNPNSSFGGTLSS